MPAGGREDPWHCTDVALLERFCGAPGPIVFDNILTPSNTVVSFLYKDGNGQPLSKWSEYFPLLKTGTATYACTDRRNFTVEQYEWDAITTLGGSMPASLAAKLRTNALPAEPSAAQAPAEAQPAPERAASPTTQQDPAADTSPSVDAPRTTYGGGDSQKCMSGLTGLLRAVVTGSMSQDAAEAEVPDANGTLALRTAIEGVRTYRETDGIATGDAITQASDAFTYPCGLG